MPLIVKDIVDSTRNGLVYTIDKYIKTNAEDPMYSLKETKDYNVYESEIEPYTEPVADEEPRVIRIGDFVRLPNGDEVKVYDIKTLGVGGRSIYIFRQKHDVYFSDEIEFISRT